MGVNNRFCLDPHSNLRTKSMYKYCFMLLLTAVTANPILPLKIHSASSGFDVKKAVVKLSPAENTGKPPVYGQLILIETSEGVYINGKIIGLEKGLHGFHVHTVGDIGNNCLNAGSHFNPFEVRMYIVPKSYRFI